MLLSLLKWFRGYVTILLYGDSPERFMNLCRKRGILLWNMHTYQGYCICNISVRGFRLLRPIARKTKTRPVIQRKAGFPFFIKRYQNRTGFLAGMILCLFFLYYSSLFVWKITVVGEYTHTEEEMIRFLKTQEIMVGTKISAIDAASAEEEIRKQFRDIGWVSIEITGTRLYVHLAETNMPVDTEYGKEEESNLIASHDGVIESIITRNGTPLVEKNQEVKKGDVLVSGVIEMIGDDGNVIERKLVAADADILLKTRYRYQDQFPMEYEAVRYTGNEKRAYGLVFFGHAFFVENPLKTIANFKKYDIIMNEQEIHLGKNFILPIKLVTKQWREYEAIPKLYSKEEAKAAAKEKLQRYLDTLQEKDVEILEQRLAFSIEKASEKKKVGAVSMAAVSGTIHVLEPQKERGRLEIKEILSETQQENTELEESD